jgi:hypothetical protein
VYDFQEDERVQYDDKDGDRIEAVAAGVTADAIALVSELGFYRDELAAPVDEDSVLRMKERRQALVAAYAFMQESLKKVGFAIRVNHVDLQSRLSINSREELDTSGL